jgi:hypothetical protein
VWRNTCYPFKEVVPPLKAVAPLVKAVAPLVKPRIRLQIGIESYANKSPFKIVI